MYMIRPIQFLTNQGLVTSTNITADSTTEWTSGTRTVGDLCKVTTTSNGASEATYKIYEAITTVGDDPTADVANYPNKPGIGTNWKEVGSVNEWAWANDVIADQCVGSSTTIEIKLTPGQIVNAIAMANLDAETVNIKMTDPTDGVVYNEDTDLVSYVGIDDEYNFCFEPIVFSKKMAAFNLPPYPDAVIDLTISVSSGNPSVGMIVAGQQFYCGRAQRGTRFGFDDFSRIEYVPELGRTILEPRNYSEEARVQLLIEDNRLEAIRETLQDSRGLATAWMANLADPGTLTFGILREMVVTLRTNNGTYVAAEIGGLT